MKNSYKFLTHHKELVKKLTAEVRWPSRTNVNDHTEGCGGEISLLESTTENRYQDKGIICLLHDLGISHHYKGSIPHRMEALYGPGKRDLGEKHHMEEVRRTPGLEDEWWFSPICSPGIFKHLDSRT